MSDGGSAQHVLNEQRAAQERFADDLNDDVIQELFAVGLGLHDLAQAALPEHRARITGYIDRLDTAIRGIRATAFDLAASQSLFDSM